MSEFDQLLDASGLSCPLPLLKAKQSLNKMSSGEVLKVIATDAGSVRDFKAFTDLAGHELMVAQQNGNEYIYVIRKQ